MGFEPIRPREGDPKRWLKIALYPAEYDCVREAYEHAYGKAPRGDELSDWCFAIIAGFVEDVVDRARARRDAASAAQEP